MVTVIDFEQMINEEGEPFNALVLRGDVEMVKSQESGKYYATARKARIPSTFEQDYCQQLIGNTMPGEIQRVSCEPYEYEIPETGEKVILEHSWEYSPEPVTTEEHVFENGQEKLPA